MNSCTRLSRCSVSRHAYATQVFNQSRQKVRSTGMSVRRTIRASGRTTQGVTEATGSVTLRPMHVTHPALHTSSPTFPTIVSPSATRLAQTHRRLRVSSPTWECQCSTGTQYRAAHGAKQAHGDGKGGSSSRNHIAIARVLPVELVVAASEASGLGGCGQGGGRTRRAIRHCGPMLCAGLDDFVRRTITGLSAGQNSESLRHCPSLRVFKASFEPLHRHINRSGTSTASHTSSCLNCVCTGFAQ